MIRTLTDPMTTKLVLNAAGQKRVLEARHGTTVPVPQRPARVAKFFLDVPGQDYESFNVLGISREEANQMIVALERVPNLRYIALELMRAVNPILEDEGL